MKVALTALALVTLLELVLGVPVYGPPQPLPAPQNYRSPNGAPIPAKYPSHPSSYSGKNEFYSKFNPHSLPPGLRGPTPQFPPPFAKFPHSPPPGKHQQHYQQQNQHQSQQHQPQHHQQQQHQLHHHQQQQQQKQHQIQPHHPPPSFRPVGPVGPQFQSKPHLLQNGAPHHPPQQGQVGGGPEQRIQSVPSRPTPKITNVWTGPKLSAVPDFPPRFPVASPPVISVTATPLPEKPRGPYIINSDDERGPIKTIPAPNLNPADKPANFDEQLYRAQHQQSYVQPLDNSITDDKQSYQVTEDPSVYKPFSSQPSYFTPDLTSSAKVPSSVDSNSVPTVPLDIALQQHLENQHHQQLQSAEHVGAANTLTPQELYSLLNGNPSAAVVPQTTYMVPQQVMYAVPQPQPLDLQVGHQLQYQPQQVQLQYAQQPAATAVQLQYAQPATADVQYLQPQTVQYQPQAIQYQPQAVQYQVQADQQLQQQQQQQQQQYQEQSAEQYGVQTTAAETSAQKQQKQQERQQEQQDQLQQQQEQEQQQQRDQLKQQQQEQEQLQQQQQVQNNDVQYVQQEQDDYEPRNGDKGSAERAPVVPQDDEHDQNKFESIRNQYYSAVPNEQTAGVLAQIAQSAANNDVAVAEESSHVSDVTKPAEKSAADQSAVQMHTSVQIQQSVPLYEGTYTSSRRTNQEYADEGGEADELMEGSESVAVSEASSVNGHAPSQFPYSAAKINAFATN